MVRLILFTVLLQLSIIFGSRISILGLRAWLRSTGLGNMVFILAFGAYSHSGSSGFGSGGSVAQGSLGVDLLSVYLHEPAGFLTRRVQVYEGRRDPNN